MYIHKSLSSSSCTELDDIGLEDAVFRIIKLNDQDNLLVCVVYRSTSNSKENDEKLLKGMNTITNVKNISHLLVVMGDFNLPEIKWKEMYVQGGIDTFPVKFYDLNNDIFLYQYIDEFTRFRVDQDSLLVKRRNDNHSPGPRAIAFGLTRREQNVRAPALYFLTIIDIEMILGDLQL